MSERIVVSIVLSTFNRCELLGPAIARLLSQAADNIPHELVIVDDNSTDDTRSVVERHIPASHGRLRYVFEPRQGLAYARNAGIAASRGDLIAFTDDDVWVDTKWVATIARAFERYPDVDALGGRTLPQWPSPPPPWLTRLHWVGPLALQDYGDEPFLVDASRAICLAGANLAFRKSVFDRIGLFSGDFPRSEDTELLLRFWLAGFRALYVPDMIAHARVQPERLEKAYHRRWHANIGRCNARMRFEERSGNGLGLRPVVPDFARVCGVPLFALRQLAAEASLWLFESARRRQAEAFLHESRVRALVGYVRESFAKPPETTRVPS